MFRKVQEISNPRDQECVIIQLGFYYFYCLFMFEEPHNYRNTYVTVTHMLLNINVG